MQHKIRINDLARELEVKSKSILDVLPKVGVTEKKTHSSSIEEDEAERVKKYFAEQAPSGSRSSPLVGGSGRRVQAKDRPVAHLQARRCAEGHHAAGRPTCRASASSNSAEPGHARRGSTCRRSAVSRSAAAAGSGFSSRCGQHAAGSSAGAAEASSPLHHAAVGRASAGRHCDSTQAAGSSRGPADSRTVCFRGCKAF